MADKQMREYLIQQMRVIIFSLLDYAIEVSKDRNIESYQLVEFTDAIYSLMQIYGYEKPRGEYKLLKDGVVIGEYSEFLELARGFLKHALDQ